MIERLSKEPISTSDVESAEVFDSSFAGGEQLWALIEPFVEKHIEDRELHMREEAHQKIGGGPWPNHANAATSNWLGSLT